MKDGVRFTIYELRIPIVASTASPTDSNSYIVNQR